MVNKLLKIEGIFNIEKFIRQMIALFVIRAFSAEIKENTATPESTNDEDGDALLMVFAVVGNLIWLGCCLFLCVFCCRSCWYRAKRLNGQDFDDFGLSESDREAIPPTRYQILEADPRRLIENMNQIRINGNNEEVDRLSDALLGRDYNPDES
jgi:hypothetical protein